MTSNKTDAETAKSVADTQKLIKEIIASRFTSITQSESYPNFVNTLGVKRKQLSPLQANFIAGASENQKLVTQLHEHFMRSPLSLKQDLKSESCNSGVKAEAIPVTENALHIADVDITANKDNPSVDDIHSKPLTDNIEEMQAIESKVTEQPTTPMSLNSPQSFLITEIKQSENQQIVLTEDQLAEMPVKDLNSLLRGLPETEVLKLKQRRRTIKNRGYAQTSRTKKTTQKSVLEAEKNELEDLLKSIKRENEILKRERDEARIKLEAFERFAGMSGIVVMDKNNISELRPTSSHVNNASVASSISNPSTFPCTEIDRKSDYKENNAVTVITEFQSNNTTALQNLAPANNLTV